MRDFRHPIVTFLLRTITTLDNEAFTPLKPHTGKTLTLEIEPHAPLHFKIEADRLVVIDDNPEPDVLLKGPIKAFLQLARDKGKNSSHLHMKGDMELARAFYETFKQLDVDIEGALSKVLGNPLAVALSKGASQTKQWFSSTFTNRKRDVAYYLQDEKGLLPTAEEIEQFQKDVITLRDDVERLGAKLALYEQRIQG